MNIHAWKIHEWIQTELHKELGEIMKTIKDMKEKFTKDTEILKKEKNWNCENEKLNK
jgi:hypothetical protein